MVETLQQKIDAIWHDIEYMDCIREIEIDRALQEFREQIEAMKEEHMFLDGYKGACIDVLALIGEKNRMLNCNICNNTYCEKHYPIHQTYHDPYMVRPKYEDKGECCICERDNHHD